MGLQVSKMSSFPTAHDCFQGDSFIILDLQICETLYDLRFMFCLIFPYKEFLSSLQ